MRGVVSIVRSYRWSPAQVPVEVETTVELRAGERSAGVRASRSRTRSPIIGFGFTSRSRGRLSSPPRRASSPSSSGPSRPRRGSVRSRCRPSPPTASSTPAGWRRSSSTRWSTSGRRPRAGADHPPLDRADQPQRTRLPRESRPARRLQSRPRSAAGREHRFRAYPTTAPGTRPGCSRARALPPSLCRRAGGGARRPDQRDRPGATR